MNIVFIIIAVVVVLIGISVGIYFAMKVPDDVEFYSDYDYKGNKKTLQNFKNNSIIKEVTLTTITPIKSIKINISGIKIDMLDTDNGNWSTIIESGNVPKSVNTKFVKVIKSL